VALSRADPETTPQVTRMAQKRAVKGKAMGRIVKALLILVLLGLVALTGYAYLADLSPTKAEMKVPVTLNAD
jgi:hypothetical protein